MSYPVEIVAGDYIPVYAGSKRAVWMATNCYVFIFFRLGNTYYYCSSNNPPAGFSAPTLIVTPGHYVNFAVWYDDPYFYLTYSNSTGSQGTNQKVFFKRGSVSAGTITWGSLITVRDFGASTTELEHMNIATNDLTGSNKRIWISVCDYDTVAPNVVYAYKSSSADGSGPWTQYSVEDAVSGIMLYQALLPKSADGDMVVCMARARYTPKSRVWDESAGTWGAMKTIVGQAIYYDGFSACQKNYKVHFVSLNYAQSYQYYAYQDAGSETWSATETVKGAITGYPVITVEDDGTPFVWFVESELVEYRDRVNASWGSDHTFYTRTGENPMYLALQEKEVSNRVCLAWREAAAPINLMFGLKVKANPASIVPLMRGTGLIGMVKPFTKRFPKLNPLVIK